MLVLLHFSQKSRSQPRPRKETWSADFFLSYPWDSSLHREVLISMIGCCGAQSARVRLQTGLALRTNPMDEEEEVFAGRLASNLGTRMAGRTIIRRGRSSSSSWPPKPPSSCLAVSTWRE